MINGAWRCFLKQKDYFASSSTHFSVFFSTTFVQDGLLLFSSVSFLEMKAAAWALLLWLLLSGTFPDPPAAPDALGFSSTKLRSFLPTVTVMVPV